MAKIVYKPVGLVLGATAGLVAKALSKQAWKLVSRDGTPNATDEHRTWQAILVAAAVQGAVFGTVKATVDRGGAILTRRLTGGRPA
ncbi:DUF4235 domain-containing protein [Kitasatospora sp. NPDC101801]|uniref:DUF4235 domain-containing protein n=1 Tax=Kitasatospora sp. NPDC101801 TaxID=3364103 RepID=UPI00381FF5F6